METWGVWEPDGTLNVTFDRATAAHAWCQRMNQLGHGGWTWGSLGYPQAAEQEARVMQGTFGERLVEAILLDDYPSLAICVDFGITDQAHYEALYHPVRAGEIRAEQLDQALGNGPALTALVRAAPSTPRPGLVFKIPYDLMHPGETEVA